MWNIKLFTIQKKNKEICKWVLNGKKYVSIKKMDRIVKEMIHIFDQICIYNFCTSKMYFKKSEGYSTT